MAFPEKPYVSLESPDERDRPLRLGRQNLILLQRFLRRSASRGGARGPPPPGQQVDVRDCRPQNLCGCRRLLFDEGVVFQLAKIDCILLATARLFVGNEVVDMNDEKWYASVMALHSPGKSGIEVNTVD
jgi:hypothetical protein